MKFIVLKSNLNVEKLSRLCVQSQVDISNSHGSSIHCTKKFRELFFSLIANTNFYILILWANHENGNLFSSFILFFCEKNANEICS